MTSTEFPAYKGFAILIKAPNTLRTFVPREGETITITDKHGKQLWSFKNLQGQGNPGLIVYDVQIDLLTEREFGNFAQKTWNRGPVAQLPGALPASRAPGQPAS